LIISSISTAALPQHTNVIGTPEQPTIDGGIINAVAPQATQLAVPHLPLLSLSSKQNYTTHNMEVPPRLKQPLATIMRDNKLKLAYVLKKIEEKGLPASIATLPIIESRYQTTAISPKGAAGVWQLMPDTAQQYGLARDERHQFVLATEAALNLLHHLYQQFNNWELAFAAYNAGTARVQKALHQQPHAITVQELDLPTATKNYVAQIMELNRTMDIAMRKCGFGLSASDHPTQRSHNKRPIMNQVKIKSNEND